MADHVGRKLGLPSTQFNPAIWGKAFRQQEPAVSSTSVRTADLISVVEAFAAGDRSVRFRWPRTNRKLLMALPLIVAACLTLEATTNVPFLNWMAITLLGLLLFAALNHPVINFTVR
jgi:hypothetical protein